MRMMVSMLHIPSTARQRRYKMPSLPAAYFQQGVHLGKMEPSLYMTGWTAAGKYSCRCLSNHLPHAGCCLFHRLLLHHLQVYKAVLRDSGEEVAVKVQRPGIEPVILRDLFIFRALGQLFNTLSRQVSKGNKK